MRATETEVQLSSMRVRAIRGATTVDLDEAGHVGERTRELMAEICKRNVLQHDDIISIWFTATPDIHSAFPATGVRNDGYGDIPLICAQELQIEGAMSLCIRVMVHAYTPLGLDDIGHVYLHGAVALRDDLKS